jgi:hypothetical protein
MSKRNCEFFDCKARLGLSINDAIRFMFKRAFTFVVDQSGCEFIDSSEEDPKLTSHAHGKQISIGRVAALIQLRGQPFSEFDETSHFCKCRRCVTHVTVEPKSDNIRRKRCHGARINNFDCNCTPQCLTTAPSDELVRLFLPETFNLFHV